MVREEAENLAKTQKKVVRKRNTAIAPVQNMTPPFTTQQFFDTPAHITNGQLLAMNPKFSMQVAKQLRKPVARRKKEETPPVTTGNPITNDAMQGVQRTLRSQDNLIDATMAENNNQKSTALYCNASINNIEFPLIIDTGSAGSIMSLSLMKDLDMEITHPSKTIMVNVNGERRRPLGAIEDVPLKIKGTVVPMNVIVTTSDTYAAIVGNDWLRKVKASIDMNNHKMVMQWKGKIIKVPIESQEMPHHRTSIEVPVIENDEEIEEELEEESEEESEEEYEEETNLNEQIYYHAEFVTEEVAIEIEKELIEQTRPDKNFIELDSLYQYKETEKGEFHVGELTKEERKKFQDFMKDYQNLFVWEPDEFGRTSVIKHTIDTGDALPIKQRFYRTSHQNQLFIKEEIQRMLKNGLILPSKSQWTSPVVIVEKKNGKKRFCVDFRKLNAVTKKDNYPLPRIDDMLETLSGSRYFSSLDLASGFWQVELDPKDREKTTFITRFGTYEFVVMPFGLCNAPATFQRLMDTVLRDILWQFVVVYIDDINVGSKTFEEHLQHLEQVFKRLQDAGIKLSPEKCFFFKEKLPFLGHVISKEGIQTDPEKLITIKNFPIPKDLTQLRGFIALASYYRKFVKNFSTIAEPLNRLLKKNTPYNWTRDQNNAFEKLKGCLMTPPILAYPDFERPFILYTDASTFALGAILSQLGEDKKEHVIAYASRTLNIHERKYSITELECLAVVWAVKHYHHYLHGQSFTVITDHAALAYLKNMTNPVGRLGRWLMILNGYNMKIIHRSGKQHSNVDTLSRIQH